MCRTEKLQAGPLLQRAAAALHHTDGPRCGNLHPPPHGTHVSRRTSGCGDGVGSSVTRCLNSPQATRRRALAALDALFGASADYYAKEITIYHCKGAIILFDGMASLDSLWELLLDAASRQALQQPCPCTGQEVYERILHGSASLAESTPVEDLPDLVKRLTAGMAVLLLDGCAKGIAFSV